MPWPWLTCDAALTEAFYLLGERGAPQLTALLRRGALKLAFNLSDELETVLALMEKYGDVPMSLADACLVRMSERISEPMVVTTDHDFRIYRRNGRQIVPCLTP
jgi:predicted nucleic acid-binding protein